MEPIVLAFVVACSPTHAFDTWTRRTSLWWPKGHSVTQDPQLEVRIEPQVGGRIYERTPAGDEHTWGELTAWDPPRGFAYRWHLRQDPADATDVEVTFAATADGATEVRIVHGGFERLGERGGALREGNRNGWGGMLPHYQVACVEEARATERNET